MANSKTFQDLAQELYDSVNVNAITVRKNTYNKQAHLVTISVPSILEQIQSRLGLSVYKVNSSAIEKLVEVYSKAIYIKATNLQEGFITSYLNGNTTKGFAVQVISLSKVTTTQNETDFRILVISLNGRGSSFNKANNIISAGQTNLITSINKLTGKNIGFDLGHITAVSSLQVQDAALDFSNATKTVQVPYRVSRSMEYKTALKFSMEAKKRKKFEREFFIKLERNFKDTPIQKIISKLLAEGADIGLITSIVEDSRDNQLKGAGLEQRTKNAAIRSFKKVLDTTNLARVRSSPSITDEIIDELLNRVEKGGAKVKRDKNRPRKQSGNTKPIKKDLQITNKVTSNVASKSNSSTDLNGIKTRSSQKSNWLQLLPMINSRLPDTVAQNMGSPRLNFRTGRLAQSAKVVNIEQTREGFPSFVFDYERDPYDVFDRTLGRSPWNTPQRDPRTLVDQSVREIVREMAIGRFFTRRA
jgi:hypothetical protein